MNFKESGFMYALGGFIVVFVLAQSLFFLIRAWKQGKKLGLSTAIMRGTVTQSALWQPFLPCPVRWALCCPGSG